MAKAVKQSSARFWSPVLWRIASNLASQARGLAESTASTVQWSDPLLFVPASLLLFSRSVSPPLTHSFLFFSVATCTFPQSAASVLYAKRTIRSKSFGARTSSHRYSQRSYALHFQGAWVLYSIGVSDLRPLSLFGQLFARVDSYSFQYLLVPWFSFGLLRWLLNHSTLYGRRVVS